MEESEAAFREIERLLTEGTIQFNQAIVGYEYLEQADSILRALMEENALLTDMHMKRSFASAMMMTVGNYL